MWGDGGLNQRTSRGGGHGRETGIIDLGHEPPLSVDGSEAAVIDRRRVSVQWFSGTILTGLCGAALIGGAVFASLDGEMTFAKVPERVEGALRGAFGVNDRSASLHKSDRLPPPGESTAARNVVRVSTVSRVGNRDVMRVRPYIRISGNLSMTTSDLSAKIPPFNAQRMLSDVGSTVAAVDPNNADAVEPDAEVSFVTKDLAQILPKAKVAAVVALDEILMRVRDASNWRGGSGVRYALANATADATGSSPDVKLAYATEGGTADPYAGFETRVVPENVTLLPKTKDQVTGGNPNNERVHVVKKGDSVISILREQGATPEEAKSIATTLGARGRDGGLKEGQKLRILMAPATPGPGQRLQPYRVIVANDSTIEAVAALSDLGKYVAVDVQSMNTVTETADNSDDDEDDGTGVRLYQSIYETALRNKVPPSIIEDMVRIYSYDVDFQRKVQPGDSFDVFFAGDDETTAVTEKAEVLFASLTVGGETKKYYKFQTPDDSVVDFYDETGKSAKKFLVRKPVNNAIMRSGFGGRRHPILGYVKMHTGVDWATPYGTPIFASGNGVVEKVGWEGGYGKYVRLKHNNGYETAYGHMSAYAKGMEPGKRVRQGQVIGFVGSTGMSTGAHVHYEILVNGRFVDPMRVKLPRGRSLEGPLLASFEKERDRLDAMMNNRGGAARVSDAAGTAGVRQTSNR
ncbi:MAG TPA: M23 family metallopeptidase [Bradyrhizobium sp.]|nr:M23 family metallopeptidase [Bradyrhizobium sp.]